MSAAVTDIRRIRTGVAAARWSFEPGEYVRFEGLSTPQVVLDNSEPYRGGAEPHELRRITQAMWDAANRPLPAEPTADEIATAYWTSADIQKNIGVDPTSDAARAAGFPKHAMSRGGRSSFSFSGRRTTTPTELLWSVPEVLRWRARTAALRTMVAK